MFSCLGSFDGLFDKEMLSSRRPWLKVVCFWGDFRSLATLSSYDRLSEFAWLSSSAKLPKGLYW